jgi:hypothetical protein
MAQRAKGAFATAHMAFQSDELVIPTTGWYEVPFAELDHGAEQPLIDSDLLGQGRDDTEPSQGPIDAAGRIAVPCDLRYSGLWLKAALGEPVSRQIRASGKYTFAGQPANGSSIGLNGTVWTFVTSGATGNEVEIGANLAATLTALATALNASADGNTDDATYVATATELLIAHKIWGGGNGYTLGAGSTSPDSKATRSGALLTGGSWQHLYFSGGPRMRGKIAFDALPTNNSTLTIGGTTWTFVSGTPSAAQTKIGATVQATLAALAENLNASVDAAIAKATYGHTADALIVQMDAASLVNALALVASVSPDSNGTVTQATLPAGLPPFALQQGHPDAADPSYFVTVANKVGSLAFRQQRDGLTRLDIQLMARGEEGPFSASQTGEDDPTALVFRRFAQANGQVTDENDVVVADLTGFQATYSNNTEVIPGLRSDGKNSGIDEGKATLSLTAETRFSTRDNFDAAKNFDTRGWKFGFRISDQERMTWSTPNTKLPLPRKPISGPGGIQTSFAIRASRGVSSPMLQVELRNDVANYD